MDDQDGWKDKELSRREFLKLLGVGSLGVGLALFGIPKALKTIREASKIPEAEASRQVSDKVNNKNMLGIFYYPWPDCCSTSVPRWRVSARPRSGSERRTCAVTLRTARWWAVCAPRCCSSGRCWPGWGRRTLLRREATSRRDARSRRTSRRSMQ